MVEGGVRTEITRPGTVNVAAMSTWREKVKSERASSFSAPSHASPYLPAATGVSKSKNLRRGGKDAQAKRRQQPGAQTKRKGNASLKGKIRGLQRTLKHQGESMTPAARAAKEEEIASLVALSDDRMRRERERDIAKKYHMVKFFERRKIMRRIEKIKGKEGKVEEGEVAVLKERREALENDMHYVVNFPKDKPYVALFPSDGHTEESRAEVENMRALILAAGSGAAPAKGGGEDAAAAVEDNGGDDDFFLEES